MIDQVWPAWREVRTRLAAANLPPTPDGYCKLLDRDRATGIRDLPSRINRRTAAALTASHSKAELTDARRRALGEINLTHDGTIRLRPPKGLSVSTSNGCMDVSRIAAVLGEVSIPERAFIDGLTFDGSIRAVLLVENLGAWRDLPRPKGWLFAHLPGWDTSTIGYLFNCLPQVTFVHFGDIDPNGVRILLHMREREPNLKWFLPSFWFELTDVYGLRANWPEGLNLDFAPKQIRELAERGLWLEQERIVFDSRIVDALERVLAENESDESAHFG